MNERLLFTIALRSLLHHKGRAVLTMLGIIIGIGAIIATLAIGKGAEAKIKAKISSLGDNYLHISPGAHHRQGKVKESNRKKTKNLRFSDVQALEKQLSGIDEITPFIHVSNVASYKKNNLLCRIKGGNEHLLSITKRALTEGRNFTTQEIANRNKVILLGSDAKNILFKQEYPLGKQVEIMGKTFTVIGVIEEIKDYFGTKNPNLDLYLPFTTGQRYIMQTRRDVVHGISISAHTPENVALISRQAARVMRDRHNLQEDDGDDFTIYDQQTIARAAEESSQILQLLLLIIASISLLVGGVGVMNIMLVSVAERTREIGIRMALGAQSQLIMRQFLYESVILCLAGGIIGIIVGTTVPAIVASMTGWKPIVTASSVFWAFFITTTVGIFFGLYPAHKASQLDPVTALADN